MLFFTRLRIRFNLLSTALAIALVIAVFITSCSQQRAISDFRSSVPSASSSTRSSTLPAVQLNQQFQLKMQQVAAIEADHLKIQFLDVSDDSRCPADVQCFWAGQATVVIGIVKDGNNLGNVSLVLGAASQEQATAHFDDYTISLLELTPYPQQNQQIELVDYTATLLVSR